MTIALKGDKIEWWFSFGIFRQQVPLKDVGRATAGHVTLLSGLGVRTDGRNWLWIVSGTDVVELHLTNGKEIRLGSPDAQRLALLINERISPSKSP